MAWHCSEFVHSLDMAVLLFLQFRCPNSAPTSNVQHPGARSNSVDGNRVRRDIAKLKVVFQLRRMDVEIAPVKDLHLMQPRAESCFDNVPSILESIDVADLISVVSWN